MTEPQPPTSDRPEPVTPPGAGSGGLVPSGGHVPGAVPYPPPAPLIDVASLLEASQPAARVPRLWFLAGGFLLVVLVSAAFSSRTTPQMRNAVELLSAVLMLGLMAGLSGLTVLLVRKVRNEQQQLESAGEMVQLRRWPEAAALLERYLSRPSRSGQLRAQALVYLASVLSRYHRFADAIAVQEHLLEHEGLEPGAAFGLRLGRAMAMLREDHLFDADRAISELRRMVPGGVDSAGLALVELYRDVKTGHPAEAVELFERTRTALRDQLGHRCADAWALAARAYDLLQRTADAQASYENATLLAPPSELFRRYPEVEKLKDRYAPAVAPPEAA